MYVAYCRVDAARNPKVKAVLAWGTAERGIKILRCADHTNEPIGCFHMSDVEWAEAYVSGNLPATMGNIKNKHGDRFLP